MGRSPLDRLRSALSFEQRDPARSTPTPAVVGPRDPSVRDALARDGFVRLGQVYDDAEVRAARQLFDDAVQRLGRPIGDEWFPTAMLPEDDVRTMISTGLVPIVRPKLDAVIDPTVAQLLELQFSVKPASGSSELGPHQDFSIVDERRSTSLYVWIPLEDVDVDNGTLHVVPGSHRFANSVRSFHVPSTFDSLLDDVRAASVPLTCRAGELVVMVSGVIHHSPPNHGDGVRLAAHGILKPVAAPMVYFYADEQTPEGMVELYEVSPDDYVRQIARGRPGDDVPLIGLIERPPTMTSSRFEEGRRATRDARG